MFEMPDCLLGEHISRQHRTYVVQVRRCLKGFIDQDASTGKRPRDDVVFGQVIEQIFGPSRVADSCSAAVDDKVEVLIGCVVV